MDIDLVALVVREGWRFRIILPTKDASEEVVGQLRNKALMRKLVSCSVKIKGSHVHLGLGHSYLYHMPTGKYPRSRDSFLRSSSAFLVTRLHRKPSWALSGTEFLHPSPSCKPRRASCSAVVSSPALRFGAGS